MRSIYIYTAPPHECAYLADQEATLEYEVAQLSAPEYLHRMLDGWRRFGHTLFHPICTTCKACLSLRIPVADFHPDRSQRRCRAACAGVYQLQIGRPSVSRTKLELYDRYHAYQTSLKGWPEKGGNDAASYEDSFVQQPFRVEEWCFYRQGQLVGVGYVDPLDSALPDDKGQEGLSLIYFFYDPKERDLALGTYNVLTALDQASSRGLPYLYLGYYVGGCGSVEYKARFRPNQILGPDGRWQTFRE